MLPTTTAAIAGVLARSTAFLPENTAASNVARQIWGLDYASPTSTFSFSHCTPFTLPSNGIIELPDTVITITADATFQPECTGALSGEIFSVADLRDPFYASTIPQTYVIAASTVIAWILVTMLVITPRTAFLGAPSASPGLLYGRGIIGGASGGLSSLTGAGSRPWLQKLATLTAAISLTIATADTFTAAQHQYQIGFMDAQALRDEVLGSLEIRIVRVISDIFLWLAQVQTLIRLFPRHKEKVLIKWIGFALIALDTIFSCLNSFMINTPARSPRFQDAIPALSYLFELALGLLYAAWVIYYALTKRRYAFYHPKMRNICIIATLSIVAVSTPVVFFITDVSNPEVAGWGDYVRWVGAGAASVVVWEWVERIEAIERDEKKDGILGREVFDGDEMLDVAPTEEAVWSHSRSLTSRFRRKGGDGDYGGGGLQPGIIEQGRAKNTNGRFRPRNGSIPQHFPLGHAHSARTPTTTDLGNSISTGNAVRFGNLPASNRHDNNVTRLTPPPPNSQTPVSRADTTSAASTVYVVRYHDAMDVPQPIRRGVDANGNTKHSHAKAKAQAQATDRDAEKEAMEEEPNRNRNSNNDQFWHSVTNPFKRKRASPPKEVQQARAAVEVDDPAVPPRHNFSRWDFKNRLGVLAAETGERFRDRGASRRPEADIPVTIIPAQPRGSGRMWSPQVLETPSEQSPSTAAGGGGGGTSHVAGSSDGSTTLINSNFNASPFRSSNTPAVPGPAVAGRSNDVIIVNPPTVSSRQQSTVPRPDHLTPTAGASNGGTIIVPAPERRTPSEQNASVLRSRAQGSSDSSAPSSAPRSAR